MTRTHSHDDAAIRERAYLLWEQEGRPHGREMEFWSRAEVAMAETEQMQELSAPPPKPKRAAASRIKDSASAAGKAAKAATALKPKSKPKKG